MMTGNLWGLITKAYNQITVFQMSMITLGYIVAFIMVFALLQYMMNGNLPSGDFMWCVGLVFMWFLMAVEVGLLVCMIGSAILLFKFA